MRLIPIVAALWAAPASVASAYRKALEAGLSELEWIEGRNVVFEHRFPDSPERVPLRSQRSWSPSGRRSSWWTSIR
jgi:hypothetical protein